MNIHNTHRTFKKNYNEHLKKFLKIALTELRSMQNTIWIADPFLIQAVSPESIGVFYIPYCILLKLKKII